MNSAFATLASSAGSWDAVIWAGVGHGADLDSVRALGGSQCYVEPHPGLRRRIEARLDADGRAAVEPRPLWSADGKGVFHLANDAVSSTLLPPGEAWAGRPNLRVVEDVEVETVSLATLMHALAPDESATALLILDIGGGEEGLLAGTPEPVLRRFRHVLVPALGEQAAARLEHMGFIQVEGDGRWRLFGQPDEESTRSASEIEQLTAELAARSTELQDLAGQLESARRELDALARGHAELAAQRDEHVGLLASLQEQFAALQDERSAADARATTLQQKLTDLSQEAAQTIAALTAERDTAIGSLVEKTAMAEGLQVDRDQLQGDRDQLQARADQLQGERDRLQARADQLDGELLEARRTVALSVKLQAQRDADLADLQQRYRESQEVQERQRTMLELLGERLGVASRYFHQLADEREQG